MKILFRFPRRLVRWTSLSVCLALILTSLATVRVPPVSGHASSKQTQDEQEPKNDKVRKVTAEPPRKSPPEGTWPNLDEARQKRDSEPRAQAPIPSMMRSKRKPPESRRNLSALSPARLTDGTGYAERATVARTRLAKRDAKTARSHHAEVRRIDKPTVRYPAYPQVSSSDRLAAIWNALALEPYASSGDNASSNARIDPFNQTGNQLLARDAEWNVSLVSLPGRAGLDLGGTNRGQACDLRFCHRYAS
jgi:hypothetical protein